ncbi:MAG: hypothetical protein RIF32_00690, partial [Leptospirales bacterium]
MDGTRAIVLSGLLLIGCQSVGGAGTDPDGDPAFAYTCRQDLKLRSANDPIYGRLNAMRERRGLAPLFFDRDLSRAARAHAADLARDGRL